MTAALVRDDEAPSIRRACRRRIVILTEDSKPALGGIAEYLHQLALAASTTHDVLIVTSVPGADQLNAGLAFRYHEVPWFRAQERHLGDGVAALRRLNTLRWQLSRPEHVRRLLGAIDAQHPDSSYVLGRLSPVTFPWCQACHSLGVSYSAIGYGLELVEPLSPRLTRLRARFAGRADHWFAISRDTRDKLLELGVPESLQSLLLPGVASTSEVAVTLPQRRGVRQQLAIGDGPFVFSLAYLRRRKGIDLGIEAFAAIAKRYPDLRYVVGGNGPERASLVDLARALGVADRVLFVGSIDDATKAALFAECELFLLPNRAEAHDVEGFGIVFLEAGLHGKAVIGGNNGGVPEAVADGVTGLLVDTRDASALTGALSALLEDRQRASALGREGRERARREFRWPDRGAAFVEELDRLAAVTREDGRRRPAHLVRLRRQVGATHNRLMSGASVITKVLGHGRLAAYMAPRNAPASSVAWESEMLRWLDRAFEASGEGGVAAGYHVIHGWAASYPEVTGYLVPTLLHYGVRRAQAALLERARHAGSWLARTRLSDGAICRKQWFAGNTTPSVFNTAQVVDGWCALARHGLGRAAEGDWLALARESGRWLVAQQDPDGSWVRHAFNGVPHAYYARVAAPLARLAIASGDAAFAMSARRGLDWVVRQQTASGWFQQAGFTPVELPTTHTIGYVIEGLLQGATLLEESRYAEAAMRAADQLLAVYEASGWLPGRFAPDWRPHARWRCLTGDAQVALCWCLIHRRTAQARYRDAAARMADDIRATVRVTDRWPEISGGVQGSSPPWGEYDPYGYPTHAVKFALDLLALLDS